MIPNRDQEALAELMKEAEIYAHASMRQQGGIPPALLFHGKDGRGIIRPSKLDTKQKKDDFVRVAKLACLAHNAIATVMVSEAWMIGGAKGKPVDLTRPPSRHPDRQEVVTIIGETRKTQAQKIMPIVRTGQGKFMGFGEGGEIKSDRIEGRFTHFISPVEPPLEVQNMVLTAFKKASKIKEQGPKGRDWQREL